MKQIDDNVNIFQELRENLTCDRPRSIREKVINWAFDDVSTAETVIARLEQLDCAACFSPAPIYYGAMAREIGEHWQEIDEAIDSYRENTGLTWKPAENQTILNCLWFAYELTACRLADEISRMMED